MSISGMTCASCVNVIETKVKDLGGVVGCVVGLLSEQAEIRYHAQNIQISSIIACINGLGFVATENDNSVAEVRKPFALSPCHHCVTPMRHAFSLTNASCAFHSPLISHPQVTLSIRGMTCASCVFSIESTLKVL